MMKWLRRIARVVGILTAAAIVAIGLTLAYLAIRRSQPVALPEPAGTYAVGRTITEWTDDSRTETLGGASGRHRKLSVWIWYPAQPGGEPAPYMPADWASASEADRGVGSLLFQSDKSIQPHALADAPPAAEGAPFPVLIAEPGLGPIIAEYTVLAEDLASRGYVVIGLNPTYSAQFTVLDGQVIPRTDAGTILDDATSEQAQAQGDKLVAIWAADDRFAIDRAAALNIDTSSPFAGKLDVGRVGLWGHSFGGAAAWEACRLDARCTAAADLDGSPFGEVIASGLDRPILYIASEPAADVDPVLQRADQDTASILARAPHGYHVTISGARHFNFTDLAAEFNPGGHLLGVFGSIDGVRGLRIASDYLAAFFDQELKGQSSARLAGPSPEYPEAQIDFH